MNKGSRPIQFNIGALLVLLTLACISVGVWRHFNPSTQKILVATSDIAAQTELTSDNITFEQWPAHLIPEGAVSSGEIPVGKLLATQVRKGQMIFQADLESKPQLDLTIPKGFKVVRIQLAVKDLSGLFEPGDYVDVVTIDGNESSTILSGIKVFNCGFNDHKRRSFVGVLVSDKEAELIYEAKSKGKLKLILLDH